MGLCDPAWENDVRGEFTPPMTEAPRHLVDESEEFFHRLQDGDDIDHMSDDFEEILCREWEEAASIQDDFHTHGELPPMEEPESCDLALEKAGEALAALNQSVGGWRRPYLIKNKETGAWRQYDDIPND